MAHNVRFQVNSDDDDNDDDAVKQKTKGKERAPRSQGDITNPLDAVSTRSAGRRPSSQQLPRRTLIEDFSSQRRPRSAGAELAVSSPQQQPPLQGIVQQLLKKAWFWGYGSSQADGPLPEEERRPQTMQGEEQLEWEWKQHIQRKQQQAVDRTGQYSLYRQWYYDVAPGKHEEDHWWILRSGLPFPSYHSNPTRNFPARAVWMDGAQDLCEELRAPRIRLAPHELLERKYFLSAVQQKAEEVKQPHRIESLNLSYQNLGEQYQYEQLLTFLRINAGVRVLSLTDNFLTDLQGVTLPFLEELFLARNNIQSFTDLPSFPLLKRLSLEENFIVNASGLNPQRFPQLRTLTLKMNPIANDQGYRQRVKQAHPALDRLDGSLL
eukprot:GGOE01000362.1.p1 GENE.GGOE01000362.1~~GGOE01000362.1.p1  ORF type:complete len:379 (-),score=68.72 GGOE01000362.1:217-1353(-)